MKTSHLPIVLLACAALLAAGCKAKIPGVADIQATSGDRHIHVRAEGGAWVHPEENQFVVKLRGHELVIDREHLLLDKEARVKVPVGVTVPAGAKKFKVVFEAGTLTVTADGAEILNTPLGK